jgi:inorganic pyrophosphatase
MTGDRFWLALDQLVAEANLVIDRPKGSPHPRYAPFRYPLDYGYLEGTCSPDREGIDVWIGSLTSLTSTAHTVTGIIVTVDSIKRDAEFKLLLNCTVEETQIALAAHNRGSQTGILVDRSKPRESTNHD